MRICIVGASGKLGRYMVQHALDRGYEVVAVCREQSVGKLAEFEDRINIVPGATDDREVIKRAVAGCDGVLVVLVPRGVHGYSSGTAQAVLDHAEPGARLVFSCGWHITRDGQDVYSWRLKATANVAGRLARLARFLDLDDQVEAAQRIFASDSRWTVVRGSDLEEGDSQGLPVWSEHAGDPVLRSNITRRVDLALFGGTTWACGVDRSTGAGQLTKSSVSQTLPLPSRTTSMPIWVNPELSRLRRCPSPGGFSLNMAWLSPLAEAVIAAVVLATPPPTPQFSPAPDHCTPWAWIRSPRSASPAHRCDSPHPAARARLCLCALAARPRAILYGWSPAAARHALVWSSTAWATASAPARSPVPGFARAGVFGGVFGALRVRLGVGGVGGGGGAPPLRPSRAGRRGGGG